jgi:hemoglobin-like flavoprotein
MEGLCVPYKEALARKFAVERDSGDVYSGSSSTWASTHRTTSSTLLSEDSTRSSTFTPLVMFYDVFYDRLFDVAPGVRPLFKSSMKTQGKALVKMIGMAITVLDNSDSLVPALEALAERHIGYGARIPHYGVVGEVLMWTLEYCFGPAVFTEEVMTAWLTVYSLMMAVMIPVAYREEQKLNKKDRIGLFAVKGSDFAAAQGGSGDVGSSGSGSGSQENPKSPSQGPAPSSTSARTASSHPNNTAAFTLTPSSSSKTGLTDVSPATAAMAGGSGFAPSPSPSVGACPVGRQGWTGSLSDLPLPPDHPPVPLSFRHGTNGGEKGGGAESAMAGACPFREPVSADPESPPSPSMDSRSALSDTILPSVEATPAVTTPFEQSSTVSAPS